MSERKEKNLEDLATEQEAKFKTPDKSFKKIFQTKEQIKNLEQATESQQTKEKLEPSSQSIGASQKAGDKTDKSKIELESAFKALKEEVEDILEADLENLYLDMPKEKRVEFKVKGEETVNKISRLLMQAKVQVKKIIYAIIDWLKIVPGINKFFIKQTAKIKTDKILKLKPKQNKK